MSQTPSRAHYPCPVCGSNTSRVVYTVKTFPIVRCSGCGMVYVNPRIRDEDLYGIYRAEYFHRNTDGYENYELTENLRRKTFRRWFQDIRPFLRVEKGEALDIGCAAGYFIDVLRDNGWSAEGIELDQRMFRSLLERGYTVSDQPLESFESARRYHLITLFDVLEHLPHVNDDVGKLSRLLHDDGIIVLVTPNIESLQKRLFAKRWFQFKPREHIHYFSRATLERIAQRQGLRIVHTHSSGQYADCMFLHDRLSKYGFAKAAALFNRVVTVARLKNRHWYADTGSLFAVLEKVKTAPDGRAGTDR